MLLFFFRIVVSVCGGRGRSGAAAAFVVYFVAIRGEDNATCSLAQ